MQKLGNFKALALAGGLLSASYFAYAFVNRDNYLWLLAAVRLFQHCIGMLQHYTVNNLIYINLPKEDQTCYTSFYTIIANLSVFLSMSLGTWVVAAMDWRTLKIFGYRLTSVPVLLLVQGIATALVCAFVLVMRRHVEPEGRKL